MIWIGITIPIAKIDTEHIFNYSYSPKQQKNLNRPGNRNNFNYSEVLVHTTRFWVLSTLLSAKLYLDFGWGMDMALKGHDYLTEHAKTCPSV